MASFSIRNQNSLENIGDIYRQPSRNTTSLEPRDKTFSRSIKQNTSQTLSKDIEESYSRIVYAPRDPSRIISGTPQSHSQSDFNYSHSSGFDNYGQGQGQGQQQVVTAQSNQRQSNLNRMNQSNESNWVQASFNQPSQSHPSYSVDTKGGYNPQNRGKTMEQSQRKSSHLMPSELSRQMEQERLKASRIDSSFQSQHNQSVNWGQAKKPSKVSINNSRNSSKLNTSNSGYFEYNQTKSRYLKPERRSMLEECDQSMIHHLKDFSRYSKDSNLGELNKQLRIQQIVE